MSAITPVHSTNARGLVPLRSGAPSEEVIVTGEAYEGAAYIVENKVGNPYASNGNPFASTTTGVPSPAPMAAQPGVYMTNGPVTPVLYPGQAMPQQAGVQVQVGGQQQPQRRGPELEMAWDAGYRAAQESLSLVAHRQQKRSKFCKPFNVLAFLFVLGLLGGGVVVLVTKPWRDGRRCGREGGRGKGKGGKGKGGKGKGGDGKGDHGHHHGSTTPAPQDSDPESGAAPGGVETVLPRALTEFVSKRILQRDDDEENCDEPEEPRPEDGDRPRPDGEAPWMPEGERPSGEQPAPQGQTGPGARQLRAGKGKGEEKKFMDKN